MSDSIRILVVDDHPIVRDGLVAILTTQPDFEVVGEAPNGTEAVERARLLNPDLMLVHLEMPGMDGVEVIRRLREAMPEIRVIVFTAFDTDERILSAVRAGAKGYLLKGVPRDDLFRAIRIVNEGGSLLQPVVASKLLQHMADEHAAPSTEALTEREREVLALLAVGATNREIAGKLFISERTAKFHVSSILGKLGAGNRTEAVSIAAQMGLVDL